MRRESAAAGVRIGAGVSEIIADPAQHLVRQKAERLVVGQLHVPEFPELGVVARRPEDVARKIGILDAELIGGIVERFAQVGDFVLGQIQAELAGGTTAEIVRKPRLILRGLLGF